MTGIVDHSPPLTAMVAAIDRAVAQDNPELICAGVKQALIDAVDSGETLFPEAFVEPTPEGYARRLVYRDPDNRFSVVAMVWGMAQRTPIHDHAGKWCVECCYMGQVLVTSYDIEGDPAAGPVRFREVDQVRASRCDAGVLIPPFEYHVIEQAGPERACTIHVYSGEMTWYHAFEPEDDGTYRRVRREVGYCD